MNTKIKTPYINHIRLIVTSNIINFFSSDIFELEMYNIINDVSAGMKNIQIMINIPTLYESIYDE